MSQVLTLGIPVYNQATTIRETLASALEQDEPFTEVIVCNNHSTDGTADILAEFGSRIRVVVPPQFLRMAENWNYCIAQMRTPWFSLLSGDDLVDPEFCAGVSRTIRRRPAAGFVRTDWHNIDLSGNHLGTHHQWSVRQRTVPPRTWQEQITGPKACFAAFAARRDLWELVGGYPSDYHLIQDWIFALRLAKHAEFLRVPRPLARYRILDRPELEKKRVKLYIEDDWRYLTKELHTFPEVTNDLLRKAARSRLPSLITKLVRAGTLDCDSETRFWLREIARQAELEGNLETWFASPEQPFRGPAPSVAERAKKFVRTHVLRR